MGIVEDVSESLSILRDTTVRFLKLWFTFTVATFFMSLAARGASAADFLQLMPLPGFAAAAAWMFYWSESDDLSSDPAFRHRRAPFNGYVGRVDDHRYDTGDRAVHGAASSSNRYGGPAPVNRFRSGGGAASATTRPPYGSSRSNAPMGPSSPLPASQARRVGSTYTSNATLLKFRNNMNLVSNILSHVIYPGPVNRSVLSEVLAEMDKAEDEANGTYRPASSPPLPPHYMLLLKDDDLSQLRGVFKHVGENRLRRIWGTFPQEYLTIEEIEQYASPEGFPSRQFKYQQYASNRLEELPQRGCFNDLADCFTLPKFGAKPSFRPGHSSSTTTSAYDRPPLAQSSTNAQSTACSGGFGPGRTTFAPKSSFTTSSASTGARVGPGGRASPYSSTSAYSSASAYAGESLYGSGGTAYGNSQYGANTNNRAYNAFDDRPVGGGSNAAGRMQESTRVRDDSPYGRPAAPPPVRKKAELLEFVW